ncbi:MAG: flagellar basal body-associated FliL family protein [Pseudomonadota bacterium]
MTAEAEQLDDEDGAPKKKSKGLLFGLIGAVLLGGGTFYGVYSGMIPLPFGGEKGPEEHAEADSEGGEDGGKGEDAAPLAQTFAFVPMEPLVISLGPDAKSRHLKVSITIEVAPGAEEAVSLVTPRINDVLNTFLRAVDEREFEIPRSMLRLRAQMLRRVQLVTPKDSVRDVLIQEFVLN